MRNTQKSIQVSLKINDEILAGQLTATLRLKARVIDITNQINPEWQEQMMGMKSWSIECDGLYVKDSVAYNTLQQAFMNNQSVVADITMDGKRYTGNAILTEYPLIAQYNDTYKYRVRLLGDGELVPIDG